MGMDTKRAMVGFRRRTPQYVEESDPAQRSRNARTRRSPLVPDLTELATTLGKGYLDWTRYLQAFRKFRDQYAAGVDR
jgi:hypothetical protein